MGIFDKFKNKKPPPSEGVSNNSDPVSDSEQSISEQIIEGIDAEDEENSSSEDESSNVGSENEPIEVDESDDTVKEILESEFGDATSKQVTNNVIVTDKVEPTSEVPLSEKNSDSKKDKLRTRSSFFKRLMTPFATVTNLQSTTVALCWFIAVLSFWWINTTGGKSHVFPSPEQVMDGFVALFNRGLITEAWRSISLAFTSIFIGTIVSMIVAFLSPLPLIKPIAHFLSKMRYLPLAGITYFMTIAISSGRPMQITVLSMFMSLYFITSLLSVIADIPQEEYDLARSMKCSRWEMLWVVVIRSRLDHVVNVLRQNLAIAYMMLVTIEGIMITSGGLGAMIKKSQKHMSYAEVIAEQIVILLIGLTIDWLLKNARTMFFPYSKTSKF